MRVWSLVGQAETDASSDTIIVKAGIRPEVKPGEVIPVVPLMEHAARIEKIQERCPHKLEDGSSAVETSISGMLSDCTICGKDWDYD